MIPIECLEAKEIRIASNWTKEQILEASRNDDENRLESADIQFPRGNWRSCSEAQ